MKLLRIYILMPLIFVAAMTANGQSYQQTATGIQTVIDSVQIEIGFYSPSTVRILKWPAGTTFTKKSLSVIEKPQKTAFRVSQSGDNLVLKSKKLRVSLNLSSGQVEFSTPSGKSLLKEEKSGVKFTNYNDAGEKTYHVYQAFVLDKNEDIYGLGQQQQGRMVQRNLKLHMIQGNTDDYVPFFVSDKGYGMFWDNYSPTTFSDNQERTFFKSDVGNCVDYYFMYGNNPDGAIARMRDLTGQAPMFPLWTFGYWQSKERYKSQDELVGVVRKYRELGVPLDGIIQDWQYWGNNYLWNAMEFLNTEYYSPQKMVDDVHSMNAHMIISIWSSFGPMTKPYRELNKIGALLSFKTWPESGVQKWPPNMDYPSGVRVYDAYNPKARDIYWKYLNKGIFSLGIDGWWMDSTEPDHLEFKPSDLDEKTYLGPFRKVRNAYPLMTVGGVYTHQRAVTSAKRVFILTRSAFAGQQRYAANTWSGDVSSSWQSLRNQIPAGLNFSLSGIPYWNSDIGGFFAGAYNRSWNGTKGAKNPLFQELYVRWLQFGAFTPMMRSHGTDIPREIYQFGKKGEPVYDAIAKAINLRYSLLPYIYADAWQVTHNQSTMMRALMMDFNDPKVRNMNNEYMFGKSILVAPVVHAQYTPEKIPQNKPGSGPDEAPASNKTQSTIDFTQSKSKKVYLPAGTVWYDFWTNEKHKGGQEINQKTEIDEIPLYIKAGSIIPFGPKVQYATQKKWDDLEIRVYPGANGQFTLYEDENDNYDYEKGIYSTITFNWNNARKILTINSRKGTFPGMLEQRKFRIILVSPNNGAGMSTNERNGKTVTYTGKKISVRF
ncbi:xylosidase [Prolixibacter bellariivorans]|uniref:Xylosidase n=1 Tax=Prolixibacter bellariivorans TaxID=314319 RepID=A0A5M4B0C1_9BACT|nr:TIM-barrel domain-containing protein [Prolixibacter bellariivorans]GET33602.1 xylosidase [Prolixibacter bellariivorans]